MSDRKSIPDPLHDLYDDYCHGRIDRREFFRRAAGVTVAGASAVVLAQSLLPQYAHAQAVSFTDDRITNRFVEYPSPGGSSGTMRGYLARPVADGPFPAVLVIHENRGLNPYIQDVARQAAVAGFLALAPDGLAPVGGYPGNDDEGREMQAGLDPEKLRIDMLNSARYLRSHELSNGKLGATGFCWGGGMVNELAVRMGEELAAGAPFYGAAPASGDVSRIRAHLLIHYAETDERINAMWPEFQEALDAAGVTYAHHTYAGTRHGFHNWSTPRHDEAAAELAWERTVGFFAQNLS